MAEAPFVIDGLNLAYWCGAPPTLRVPLAAWSAVLSRGATARLVFDASTPYQLPEAEQVVYAQMLADAPQQVLQVPGGESADGHLLALAKSSGGAILSRDRFREYRRGWRVVRRRRYAGVVAQDQLLLPELELQAPLEASAHAAWLALRARLQED